MIADTDWTELKGLRRYRFCARNGELVVKSLKNGVLSGTMTRDHRHIYHLRTDSGKYCSYRRELLLFYLRNPQLPATFTDFQGKGVYLSDDGCLRSNYERKKAYDVFWDIDEALETVLRIKAYREGDVAPMIQWVESSRSAAISTVAKVCSAPYGRVTDLFDAATERFYRQLDKFNVRRIMPLFAMLCKCIKQEVLYGDSSHITINESII